MRLQGKVAVVTGGGAGIGRGIALCMAREGADIAIPDIQDGNAHAVVKEVEKLGRKAVAMRCDVTKAADVKASLDGVKKELGRIDILVNNAGMASSPGMPFTNNSEEDWDKTYAVNLKSVFLTCKEIAPHMMERKSGRIINIASIAGPWRPRPCRPTRWPRAASSPSPACSPRISPRTGSPSTPSAPACSGRPSGRTWPSTSPTPTPLSRA